MSKIFPLVGLGVLLLCKVLEAADPSGTETYTDTVPGLKYSVNFTWVLVGAFLVFIMQAGFALLGGFLRPKHMLNYMAHCFTDTTIGALVFWLFGFALMFGGSQLASGLDKGDTMVGRSGFLLIGPSYDVNTVVLWLFQVMFATKAVTIIAGAVAERTRWAAYLIYSFLVCGVVYPIYGHWMWGGGWLGTLPLGVGARDFAGSGVVHAVGGIMALIGAWAVGPRIGKYQKDGTPNAIPGHNLTFVVVGTLILVFGWFGFNAGSTLAATDLRISVIATNTFLAAAAGAAIVIWLSYATTKKPDIMMACNGALGGLVAITGPCAYVPIWAAVVIGLLAGLIMRGTVWLVESAFKIDDPLGAVSVHGANGLWGLLAVGIFADDTYGGVSGLITGSGYQLLAQFIAMVTAIAWACAAGFAIFLTLKHTIGLRVPEYVELEGLDLNTHGVECYPSEERYVGEIEKVVRRHIGIYGAVEEAEEEVPQVVVRKGKLSQGPLKE
jgi:Amt family ammonium transporter